MILRKAVVVGGLMQGDAFADITIGSLEKDNKRAALPYLMVDGIEASVPFLVEYMKNGKDSKKAYKSYRDKMFGSVTLAAVYIQQFMQKHGYECARIDGYGEYNSKQFEEEVKDAQLLLISTSFIILWPTVLMIANHARRINPNVIVIAGGLGTLRAFKVRQSIDRQLFPAAVAEKCLKEERIFFAPHDSSVDFAVVSIHGTDELLVLLKALENSTEEYKNVPNIAWYDKSKREFVMHSYTEGTVPEASADWSKVEQPDPRAWYPVQVGQGCPFRCKYCDFHVLSPNVTRAPVDTVRASIESIPLVDGVRRVYFTNDNFFPNVKMGKDFLRDMISWNLNLRWQGFTRADTLQDEELVQLMQQSGCVNVWIGMESGDDQVLKNMGKHCTREVLDRCHQNLAKYKINQRNYVIIGFPGETEESFLNTMSVLNAIPTSEDRMAVYKEFLFIVAALTPASTMAERQKFGLKGFWDKWTHNTMSSTKAEELVQRTYLEVKPELGVMYTDDNQADLIGWSPNDWNKFYRIRGLLHKRGNSIPDTDPRTNEQLWAEMEELILRYDTNFDHLKSNSVCSH